jgi:hypothetical protein
MHALSAAGGPRADKEITAKRVRATWVSQMLHLTRMIIAQWMVFSWIKSAGAPSDRAGLCGVISIGSSCILI